MRKSEIERFGLFFENSFIYLRFNFKNLNSVGSNDFNIAYYMPYYYYSPRPSVKRLLYFFY